MVKKGEYIDYGIKLSKIHEMVFSTEMSMVIELCEEFKKLQLKINDLRSEFDEYKSKTTKN